MQRWQAWNHILKYSCQHSSEHKLSSAHEKHLHEIWRRKGGRNCSPWQPCWETGRLAVMSFGVASWTLHSPPDYQPRGRQGSWNLSNRILQFSHQVQCPGYKGQATTVTLKTSGSCQPCLLLLQPFHQPYRFNFLYEIPLLEIPRVKKKKKKEIPRVVSIFLTNTALNICHSEWIHPPSRSFLSNDMTATGLVLIILTALQVEFPF